MEMGLPQGVVMLGRALTAVPVACIKQIQEQMGNGAGSSQGYSPALPWSIGEADERSFSSHLISDNKSYVQAPVPPFYRPRGGGGQAGL